jgi:hypothetical protein
MTLSNGDSYVVLSGQPCHHFGCLQHLSHPCEVCGRIGGNGQVTVRNPVIIRIDNKYVKKNN